jgi:putative heme peroxidase
VMWARERGITWGWSDGNFHYDTPAGDATIVLMLYRLAGKPDVNVPEYHREAWGDPWDKEWPNMPYGSELHKAYLWITQKTSLEKEGYIKEHYNVRFGMHFSAQAGKNSWFTFAEYDLAFSALRVADSLGAFEK